MPALLAFGDAQTADNPGETSTEGCEASCQVRMEHEALHEERFIMAKPSALAGRSPEPDSCCTFKHSQDTFDLMQARRPAVLVYRDKKPPVATGSDLSGWPVIPVHARPHRHSGR